MENKKRNSATITRVLIATHGAYFRAVLLLTISYCKIDRKIMKIESITPSIVSINISISRSDDK